MRIALRTLSGWVELLPLAYLGTEAFTRFREISRAHGGVTRKLSDGRWETAVPELQLSDACAALFSAGFELAPDSAAADRLERGRLRVLALRAREESVMATLYPFQRAGAMWLRERDRALLADSMGLGKSRQVLAAALDQPLLVVCPASVKGAWAVEAAAVRPDLDVRVLSGRGSFRWPQPGQLVVTNYDVLPTSKRERELARAVVLGICALCLLPRRTFSVDEPDHEEDCPVRHGASVDCVAAHPCNHLHNRTTVVVDEAHYCSSATAKRTTRVRDLCRAAVEVGGAAWLLTGTPILNEPFELWNVLETAPDLGKDAYDGWTGFVRTFGGKKLPHGGWWWRGPDDSNAGKLRSVMLRRTREEVLPELPVKTYRVLETDALPRATCKIVDEIEARITAAGLWDHPELLPMFEGFSRARELLAASKVAVLLELAQTYRAHGEPLVVFSAHRAAVEAMTSLPGWEVVTGSTTSAARTASFARFQAGELAGIAGTIGAMGTGVTLTRACHLVFVDRDFTPARNEQSEDRLCRIGQERGVTVTDLVAPHALDRRVHKILTTKSRLVDATMRVVSSAR